MTLGEPIACKFTREIALGSDVARKFTNQHAQGSAIVRKFTYKKALGSGYAWIKPDRPNGCVWRCENEHHTRISHI